MFWVYSGSKGYERIANSLLGYVQEALTSRRLRHSVGHWRVGCQLMRIAPDLEHLQCYHGAGRESYL